MDAVAILKFPQEYAQEYHLKKNDRLITVNTYCYKKIYFDVFYGPKYLKRYMDFQPNIGDFLSSEYDKIKNHKENIPEIIWQRCKKFGETYYDQHKGMSREGFWFIE